MAKDWLLPEHVERVTARDGVPHSIVEFEPAQTALLVIDMQNFYVMEGYPAYCANARALVPAINRLADTMRRAGGKVIWARNICDPRALKDWSVHYDRMRRERREARAKGLSKGDRGFQLWADLDARDDDLHINKTRYSAFIDDSSGIETLLSEHGIDTLITCGVTTNVCVESTARDAMMLNYRVVVVADACAANSEALHSASLNTFYLNFGDVLTSDDVVAGLERHLPHARTGAAALG